MKVKSFVQNVGWPRIIIAIFLVVLIVATPFVGLSLPASIENVFGRFGMFSILVLSLVPMIQAGCGLNMGLPVGVIAGILGGVISIEIGLKGFAGLFGAMAIGILIALVFGAVYGFLLNRIKGDEMLIATYVGYSFVAFMSIMWVMLPFKNPVSVMSYGGSGLRQQIPVADYWMEMAEQSNGMTQSTGLLSNFLSFDLFGVRIPTGMILVFIVCALLVRAFFKTKLGTSIIAVGSNPMYAKASGINIDLMRLVAVMLSTAIAAVGIIIYQQSYGYIQLYTAPYSFTFQTVAAILIGGASINKANIVHVAIGTFLFQGILTLTPVVINGALSIDVSEVIRMIVTNGMILYALTRRNKE